ncbi:hypothetical protein A2Y85_07760 [candidate division WOR-3 bacterium RBG_13_43_14]|uniref:Double zinc ribbon domain-containing protein n=1 Tax=candidate division WOR-3 bacterium RBG_13_43_14 TaxID=1802590 RepID=A0A1F4UAS2_UNCW3|nr:MAG: hypothetical protein A2Y85_07760 [candidate division WOR-3 bacterium RBG_13_43_14]
MNAFLDFLVPHDCLICGQEVSGRQICANCHDYLPEVKPPFCQGCGRPVKDKIVCPYCRSKSYIDRGRSWIIFAPPADRLIHHFKYRNKRSLARLFGRALSLIVRSDHALKQSDLIVPVPLHWWKQIKRGYNQAFLIAREISQECNIDIADILRRTRNTRTQTRFDPDQRRSNVENAFALKKYDIKDRKILLIDDVMTTGATINECARVLIEAGAKSVCSCVAAITPG